MLQAPLSRKAFLQKGWEGFLLAANKPHEPQAMWKPPLLGHAYLRFRRPAMHTDFEVILDQREGVEARRTAVAMLDEVDRLESMLTLWSGRSELAEVNKQAAKRPVPVSEELFALLLLARQIFTETGRAYDLTSTPLSKCWGFFDRSGRMPSPLELEDARRLVGMEKVELDEARRTVFFRLPGMELNPASIGKGFALDCAINLARSRGLRHVMMSGGFSSVLASGAPSWKSAWNISVRDPHVPGCRAARLHLQDQGYSNSGSEAQQFTHEGRVFSHIIDPRTGWPAPAGWNVSVVAPTAALAEAWSTAFAVMGPSAACEALRRHPELGAMFLNTSGREQGREAICFNLNQSQVEVNESSWIRHETC